MDKKREYKQIIQESLIRGGYLKKPPFKDKLEEIINDSFEDLDLLLKKKADEEIIEEYNDKDITELSDEEIIEYEKCLPDYIQSLPGSLRSTDPKELQDRLDTIDKRLGELDDEIDEEIEFQDFAQNEIGEAEVKKEEAQKNLDDYHEKEEQFQEENEKSQGEALDKCGDFRDRWDEFARGSEPPQSLDILVRTIGDSFETKGFLYGDEAESIKEIAGEIVDFAYDVSGGDDTEWTNQVIGIADDLRAFADDYDINNHPIGDDLVVLVGIAGRGEPSEWENIINDSDEIISRNQESYDESVKTQARKEKERDDLKDNKEKTKQKLSQAERNLYNVP